MELLDLNSGLVIIERAECFDLLAREEVGRLAVVVGGRPEIFPVNYVVEGDGVVFRTDPGTKLAGAIRGPVAFEVDHLDRATRTAWSVILHGHAQQATAFDSPELPRPNGQSGPSPLDQHLQGPPHPHRSHDGHWPVDQRAGPTKSRSPTPKVSDLA